MAQQKNSKVIILAESAVMLALSIGLDFIKIWEMPMGGKVTLLSMLPICLLSVKDGLKVGVPTAFLYSLYQLITGIAKGNVFIYTTTAAMVVICVLFDYLVPFTVLGFAGMFKKFKPAKFPELGILLGIILVIFIRFACHYITGFFLFEKCCTRLKFYRIFTLTAGKSCSGGTKINALVNVYFGWINSILF